MLEAIIEIGPRMRKNHTRPAGQRSRQQKPQPQRPGYLLRHSNSGNSQAKADRAAAGSLFPRRRRKHRLPPGRILFCLRSDRRHRQLCKKLPLELRFRRPAERRTPQTGWFSIRLPTNCLPRKKAKALSSTDVRSALPPIRSIFRWPRSAPALMI